jgi:hypothetical protein
MCNFTLSAFVLYISHSLTHGAEPFLRSCQLCSHWRTSQGFMEPEGSLPRSQELSTGPYSVLYSWTKYSGVYDIMFILVGV